MTLNIIRGNLWESQDEMVIVSSHGTVDSAGVLEMRGSGSLSHLANSFPGIDISLGTAILDEPCYSRGRSHLFGFVAAWAPSVNKWYGLVQTKLHWQDDPEIGILAYALSGLDQFAEKWYLANKTRLRVSMVYPGIGHGQLKPSDVRPMLETLLRSADYTIYTKKIA